MKLRLPALLLLLLAGTAAAGAATPQDISEDGAILRSCMHDLVAASCVGSAPEPDGLRRAIASHPKVLQWILEGRDLDPILEAADLKQSIGGGLGIPPNLRTQLQASPLAASLAGQIPQSSFEERMQMLARLPDAEFITMGVTTFVLLVSLTWLGSRGWKRLVAAAVIALLISIPSSMVAHSLYWF